MRHCYLCDGDIVGPAFRRSVRTGSSNRISFGRRITTSTGQRNSLRTICQTCAEKIDSNDSQSMVIGAIPAILLIGAIIYAFSGTDKTKRNNDLPAVSITPGIATPVIQPPRSAVSDQIIPTMIPSAHAPKGDMSSVQQDQTRAPSNLESTVPPGMSNPVIVPMPGSFRWRHTTENGVRWSLRKPNSSSLMLLVDLGGDQTAALIVAAGFENLSMLEMNKRVEWLKFTISQNHSTKSATYFYLADGVVRRGP